MTRKKLLLSGLTFLPFVLAAQDTTKVSTLEEVTVTASRSEEKILTSPRSVTVITALDIQKQPYQNLADLLQRYEGIFVPGTFQNPGSLQYLYLRGADNKQTLVMIDGIKLSDASTPDNGLDLNEVSLNSVERIEIVRGSQGTLYGGSAVGGVINIITKKNAKPGLTGVARVKAGSFGDGTFVTDQQVGLTYTAPTGFYARGEILNASSKGFDNSAPSTSFSLGEKDDFRKTDISGKVGINKNNWDAYVGYRYGTQKADIDDGAFKDDENNVLKFKRHLLTYGAGRKLNDQLSFKFFGGYTSTERKNFDDSSLTQIAPPVYDATILDATYTGNNLTNELQVNYKKNNFTLVGGAGFVTDKMNTNSTLSSFAFNYFSKTNYDTVGIKMNTGFVYAHGKYELPFSKSGYGLNLAGGVRYSENNRFGSFVSYEFTPVLLLGKGLSVYSSIATGYNAPSLYQMFAPERNFTSKITRGNSNLKPEESQSVELGVKAIINDAVGFRASVYHNEVKNYIDYVYLWNGAKPIPSLDFNDDRGDSYLNTGKQTNEGVEVGVDINFSDKLQLHANLTHLNGKLEYNPVYIDKSKTEGNHVQLYSTGAFLNNISTTPDLVRRPRFMSNTSLVYKPSAKFQFTADARTISNRSDVTYNGNLGPYGALSRINTDDFILFNLSALWQATSKLSVNASVFNILNTEYVELVGFQTRRRSGFATVQYNF